MDTTAARTIDELQAEILSLRELEGAALKVGRGGADRKWTELLNLLENTPAMRDPVKGLHKLVIFTERRDTLNYLYERLTTLFGRNEPAERGALAGQVFDVLGKLFQETPLRKLLVEAIRYGDDPLVRARLEQAVDNAVDQERVCDLLEHQALVTASMDTSQIMRIREGMERAAARRLQPHYIKAFFLEAFERIGGTVHERENGRYAIHNVPAVIRNWAKERGLGAISTRYERICFEKSLINLPDKLPATFVCPGHPLLDATIGLMLERERDSLRRGGMLVDETDPGRELRALFYLEQVIQDAMPTKLGERRIISREVHFVEIDGSGNVRQAGGAPYLDYRPAAEDEIAQVTPPLEQDWLKGENLERRAAAHAVEHLIPRHLERVRRRWLKSKMDRRGRRVTSASRSAKSRTSA